MITVSKELLHRLVDELPESEWQTAARLLEGLRTEAAEGGYVCPHCDQTEHEPNEETIRALKESRAGIGSMRFGSLEEMQRALDED